MKRILILAILFVGCGTQKQCDPHYHSIQEFARANNLHFEVSKDNADNWYVEFWNKGNHWWDDRDYCHEAEHCWRGRGLTAEEAFAAVQHYYPDGEAHTFSIDTKCKD